MLQFKTNIAVFGEKVKIAEFTLKEYKTVLKSLISIEHSPEIFIDTVQELISLKTNISSKELQQLSFINFFVLLMHLKCTSSSSIIEIQTEINNKKTNIHLNIVDFIEYLNAVNINQILEKDYIDNVSVTYRIPTIKEVLSLNQQDLICNFISNVSITNKLNLLFTEFSLQERKETYDSLPLKIAINIKKRADNIINYFNNIDLLTCIPELLGEINLFFNFNKNNLITLIKLIYGEDLKAIYENQFLLAKYGNVSVEYLDTCTLGEYNIFVNLLNKDINSKKDTSNSSQEVIRGDSINDIN
jgi:hypothetical protein